MKLVRWSPFREFEELFRGLEGPTAPVRRADWLPLVDIRETDVDYQIDVELPAVAAEDLSVSLADGVLSVRGERKSEARRSEARVHRAERRFGRFERNFRLPEDADAEAIGATNRDGILYLSIPKQAASSPRNIEVKVS